MALQTKGEHRFHFNDINIRFFNNIGSEGQQINAFKKWGGETPLLEY